MLLVLVAFVACSDDFVPVLVTDLETDSFTFTYEGGEESFILETNEQWLVDDVPQWITVNVTDALVATRADGTLYEKGKKSVAIVVEENLEFDNRTAELTMMSESGNMVKLTVAQEKRSGLAGYWILSEGNEGRRDSELAWFNSVKGGVATKQFKAINGDALGDTGNELQLYGSKMYVVITGSGFTNETTTENSYIEVINPVDGKSIKRIPFTNNEGEPAKPRNIIFEGGKGYISSYSNEIVRLDTATLALDAHAVLGGTFAEGLTYNNGNIYVCNGGQGQDNKISVVNAESMKETKVITTASNPSKIVSADNGDIYFTTDFPSYKLYKLKTADETLTEIEGMAVADITHSKNQIYSSYYDWATSMGEIYQFNTETNNKTKITLDLESVGAESMIKYHIGTMNGSDHLYITGMLSDDVLIFDPVTQEIEHAFKTGVNGGSGVVAVYR